MLNTRSLRPGRRQLLPRACFCNIQGSPSLSECHLRPCATESRHRSGQTPRPLRWHVEVSEGTTSLVPSLSTGEVKGPPAVTLREALQPTGLKHLRTSQNFTETFQSFEDDSTAQRGSRLAGRLGPGLVLTRPPRPGWLPLLNPLRAHARAPRWCESAAAALPSGSGRAAELPPFPQGSKSAEQKCSNTQKMNRAFLKDSAWRGAWLPTFLLNFEYDKKGNSFEATTLFGIH